MILEIQMQMPPSDWIFVRLYVNLAIKSGN